MTGFRHAEMRSRLFHTFLFGPWSWLAAAAPEVDLLSFKTEPYVSCPVVRTDYITENRSLLAPGYIFYAPSTQNHSRRASIIDNDGVCIHHNPFVVDFSSHLPKKLIWWGGQFNGHRSVSSHDLQVCDWLGESANHICFSDVVYQDHATHAPHHVLDNQYNEIDYSRHISDMPDPNQHEYNVMKGGESYIQVVYKLVKIDLRSYNGPEDGHMTDGCFQEVSTRDHKELFRWCASDHFPLWVTKIYPKVPKGEVQVNQTLSYAGTGKKGHAWDWIHLNAVDKNDEGDYIISARHWDMVAKVAGINARAIHGIDPGSVIWKVGGKLSDFELDPDAIFFRQHHVRFVKTTREETWFSVFNNAADGPHHAHPSLADGRIMAVNNVTMQARLVQQWAYPGNKSCASKGSVSIYQNGNVLVGWGDCSDPAWTEYAADGTVLLQAAMPGAPTYRVRKYEWHAQPTWDPKLVAYAPSCQHVDILAYVSWNGATEVRFWRFYIGMSSKGPWTEVETVAKVDFETDFRFAASDGPTRLGLFQAFTRHIMVEALDEGKKVLASVKEPIWIPDYSKLPSNATCGRHGCTLPEGNFAYLPELSCANDCRISRAWILVALAFAFLVLETFTAAGQRPMDGTAQYKHHQGYAELKLEC